METYRHALYRYSTGQGFNVNVNVPKRAEQVASYKVEPLLTRMSQPGFTIDVKREADRISMQVEAGMRQVKLLGYDPELGKRLKKLKVRLEVIKHLMTNYPIRYIKREELDRLYDLYEKNAPGMDVVIQRVVDENQGSTGIDRYIGTAMKVRKGYPLYDQFGRKLTKVNTKKFEDEKKEAGLSGFGDSGKTNILRLAALLLAATALFKMVSKPA